MPTKPGADSARWLLHGVAPLLLIVFLGVLMEGIPLPLLPLRLRDELGCSPVVVGSLMSLQAVACLLARPWSGWITDSMGPKVAVCLGLIAGGAGGIAYLGSFLPIWTAARVAAI